MKCTFRAILVILGCMLLSTSYGQDMLPRPFPSLKSGQHLRTASPSSLESPRVLRIPGKRASRYTPADWRKLIDSTWGPGLPTATKLEIFDTFWTLIDQRYAGFPYLSVNWDSLKALYRPEVEAGVSRGRFDAIMCQLYFPLQEVHTSIGDFGLDSSFIQGGVFVYRPGIPMFFTNGWGPVGNFGAALTPMPDSSLLVYRAVPSHPLGLVPGDIVLGYEGVPWKILYRNLLDAQLPFEWWRGWGGSTPRSQTHSLLGSAGRNWGLFDTIDVVRYASGDTVHLPTAPLEGLEMGSLFGTEQVPVQGVPIPDYENGETVSYGVLEGSTIGYVYVGRWNAVDGVSFAAAMADLVSVRKVAGLILDFRFNLGSEDSGEAAVRGFDYLFNQNPAGPSRWRNAMRDATWNHMSFSFTPSFDASVSMSPGYFDRPIAVLTGPHAMSFGDLNAFEMRFHPMARFFGLPTNGSFPVPGATTFVEQAWGSWYYSCITGQMQSLVNNEGFLMHKAFPVDEEIWLSRNGVAQGKDDVVERALSWIKTLSYAHDVRLAQSARDTLLATARVENPLAHSLKVVVTLTEGSGVLLDSLELKDDGLHGDGAAGDGLWGALTVPSVNGTFHASIRTDDLTAGTSRVMSDVARLVFTRIALISLDARTVDLRRIPLSSARRDTAFTVRNVGFAPDSLTNTVDPGNVFPDTAVAVFPAAFFLAPGDSQDVTFSIRPNVLAPAYYSAAVTVVPKTGVGQTSLTKSFLFQIVVPGGVAETNGVPKEYALHQSFPNPFNPTTVVRYQLPVASDVKLIVYDVLGREVSVLVNERRTAGTHEVKFDAMDLPSGVYFCRLQARPLVDGQARPERDGQARPLVDGQARPDDGPVGRAGGYVETRKLCLVR